MTNLDPNLPNIPISSKTGDALLEPPAKVIGNAVGDALNGMFHLILDPIRKFNIQREHNLQKYKMELENSLNNIPLENQDDSKTGLVLKALEDSRYQINSDEIRAMFVKLISTTLDNRLNTNVTPIFSSILSNMSPKEALLLKDMYLNSASLTPCVGIIRKFNDKPSELNLGKTILLLDSGHLSGYELELSLLENSNLIKYNKDSWLASEHFKKHYDSAEKYIDILSINIDKSTETLVLDKSYYSFTELGKSLCKILFE